MHAYKNVWTQRMSAHAYSKISSLISNQTIIALQRLVDGFIHLHSPPPVLEENW